MVLDYILGKLVLYEGRSPSLVIGSWRRQILNKKEFLIQSEKYEKTSVQYNSVLVKIWINIWRQNKTNTNIETRLEVSFLLL